MSFVCVVRMDNKVRKSESNSALSPVPAVRAPPRPVQPEVSTKKTKNKKKKKKHTHTHTHTNEKEKREKETLRKEQMFCSEENVFFLLSFFSFFFFLFFLFVLFVCSFSLWSFFLCAETHLAAVATCDPFSGE